MRWGHGHTFAAGALAALTAARDGRLLAGILILVFVAGIALGRFWVAAKHVARSAAGELERRAQLGRAKVREARARARMAEAKAADARSVAVEAKRRAERAAGITRSEIAQLQLGRKP